MTDLDDHALDSNALKAAAQQIAAELRRTSGLPLDVVLVVHCLGRSYAGGSGDVDSARHALADILAMTAGEEHSSLQ